MVQNLRPLNPMVWALSQRRCPVVHWHGVPPPASGPGVGHQWVPRGRGPNIPFPGNGWVAFFPGRGPLDCSRLFTFNLLRRRLFAATSWIRGMAPKRKHRESRIARFTWSSRTFSGISATRPPGTVHASENPGLGDAEGFKPSGLSSANVQVPRKVRCFVRFANPAVAPRWGRAACDSQGPILRFCWHGTCLGRGVPRQNSKEIRGREKFSMIFFQNPAQTRAPPHPRPQIGQPDRGRTCNAYNYAAPVDFFEKDRRPRLWAKVTHPRSTESPAYGCPYPV